MFPRGVALGDRACCAPMRTAGDDTADGHPTKAPAVPSPCGPGRVASLDGLVRARPSPGPRLERQRRPVSWLAGHRVVHAFPGDPSGIGARALRLQLQGQLRIRERWSPNRIPDYSLARNRRVRCPDSSRTRCEWKALSGATSYEPFRMRFERATKRYISHRERRLGRLPGSFRGIELLRCRGRTNLSSQEKGEAVWRRL
jgi:hypothetical protein